MSNQRTSLPGADANFEEFTTALPTFLPAVVDGLNCILDLATEVSDEAAGPDMVMGMLTGSISEDLHDILLLCEHDRRQSALRLIRSPYEKFLYAAHIAQHPETALDFLQYDAIQGKALISDIEKNTGPAISEKARQALEEQFKLAQEKFKRSKCEVCGESGPRMWTKVTPEQMAKAAGVQDMHVLAYRYSTYAIHPSMRGITDQTTNPIKVSAILSMVHRLVQETIQQQWQYFKKTKTVTGKIADILRRLSEVTA